MTDKPPLSSDPHPPHWRKFFYDKLDFEGAFLALGNEDHFYTEALRGFIRVEVHSVEELVQYESEKAIREAGKLRVEGKSYLMQDGDVCYFLFNV